MSTTCKDLPYDVLSDVLLRAHDFPARTIRMYAKDEFMICSHARPDAVTLFAKSMRFTLACMMHITYAEASERSSIKNYGKRRNIK
jgi:hypothetical protein